MTARQSTISRMRFSFRRLREARKLLIIARAQDLVVWLIVIAQSITFAAERDPPPAQTFRVGKKGSPILVPVKAAASQRLFWFDTGANISMFDVSLKGVLGRETRRSPLIMPNATQRVSAFAAPPISLGARPLRTVPEVLCVDLEPFREACAEPIFGLLGMDAIRTMIVRIDFDSGELSVLPSLPAELGEPLKLIDDRGIPCVRVRLGRKRRVLFSIDTGIPDIESGDLESGLFNALLEDGALKVIGEGISMTMAGTTRARKGRVAELQIAGDRHSGLIFEESSRNALSLGFLSRYVVVFDFPSKWMYLSPGKRFNDPDGHDLSGLHLSRTDGKTIVESLDDRSAAHRAGLRAGDVLLSIDQTAMDSLAPIALGRILATPSTRSLTIRRGETAMRFSLELREEQTPNEVAPRIRTSRRTFFQRLLPRAE